MTKILLIVFCSLYFNHCTFSQQDASVLPSLFNTQKDSASDKQIEARLKQQMFVKVFTSKNEVYVGEPVMATYKFYVDMRLNGRPAVTKQPEFSGWSVKELNFYEGREIETINNSIYAVYTLRRVELTPLQPGPLSLGKAYVNNLIETIVRGDMFATKKFTITVSNDEHFVEVTALPEQNKPENFYGIIGNFTIGAAISGKNIPVNDNENLIVTIKGTGNFDAIVLPEILWPANTEHFDASDSQHINLNDFPVTGDHIFNVPFIGKKEGQTVIPPIKFSFFNIARKRYQTIATDSIRLDFTKASRAEKNYNKVMAYTVTNRRYLWFVPAIAVIVAVIGYISYRRNKILMAAKQVNVTPPPVFAAPQPEYHVKYRTDFSRYLQALQETTGSKPFFEKAKDMLLKAVAERVDSSQYTEQYLVKELKLRTYNAPVCNKVTALFEAMNIHLYTPYETNADLEFYFAEIKQVIEELQQEA